MLNPERRSHRLALLLALGGGVMLALGAAVPPPTVCEVDCAEQGFVTIGSCEPPLYCCYYWDCSTGVGNLVCCTQAQECIVNYTVDPPRAGCY
jgi:hypothetical protein